MTCSTGLVGRELVNPFYCGRRFTAPFETHRPLRNSCNENRELSFAVARSATPLARETFQPPAEPTRFWKFNFNATSTSHRRIYDRTKIFSKDQRPNLLSIFTNTIYSTRKITIIDSRNGSTTTGRDHYEILCFSLFLFGTILSGETNFWKHNSDNHDLTNVTRKSIR